MLSTNPITDPQILMPGMMSMICLLSGTDYAMKKSCATFSKSIITVCVMSPSMRTGAFVLVGSTVTNVVMFSTFCGLFIRSVSEKLDESLNEVEVGGHGEDWQLFCEWELGTKLSRIGSCWETAVVQVKQGNSSFHWAQFDRNSIYAPKKGIKQWLKQKWYRQGPPLLVHGVSETAHHKQ